MASEAATPELVAVEQAKHPGPAPPARSEHIDPDKPIDMEAYNERWHKVWSEGLQPGQRFDAGRCSPVLLEALSSDGGPRVSGKRALVPGCGRGYDVIAAAAAGVSLAVGLDISALAVRSAEEHRDAVLSKEAAAHVAFEQADFFTYKHEGGPFDFGFDYTFLCALPPQARHDWAMAWAGHLSPGGELVTLIFPVDPSADPNVGPPFPVTPELYQDLLLPEGFKCIKLEKVPDHLSHPARAGREWLGRWLWPGHVHNGSSKF